MRLAKLCLLLAAGFISTHALAERTITDQLNRRVTLPDHIERAVILQHQTVNIANQLDAMGQVVGVLSNWKKQLGADYVRLAPTLPKMGTPGDISPTSTSRPCWHSNPTWCSSPTTRRPT